MCVHKNQATKKLNSVLSVLPVLTICQDIIKMRMLFGLHVHYYLSVAVRFVSR